MRGQRMSRMSELSPDLVLPGIAAELARIELLKTITAVTEQVQFVAGQARRNCRIQKEAFESWIRRPLGVS